MVQSRVSRIIGRFPWDLGGLNASLGNLGADTTTKRNDEKRLRGSSTASCARLLSGVVARNHGLASGHGNPFHSISFLRSLE
jgi:hypothetical protein